MTQNLEIEKAKGHCMADLLEYMPHSVVIRTILKKITGNIHVSSVDKGEGVSENISPFDTFIQIIEGKAEIMINGQSSLLEKGDGIIVPAHEPSSIIAHVRFKMISTVIKSGYE